MELTVEEIEKVIDGFISDVKNNIEVDDNLYALRELKSKCEELINDKNNEFNLSGLSIDDIRASIDEKNSELSKIKKIEKFATRETLMKRDALVSEISCLMSCFDVLNDVDRLNGFINKIDVFMNNVVKKNDLSNTPDSLDSKSDIFEFKDDVSVDSNDDVKDDKVDSGNKLPDSIDEGVNYSNSDNDVLSSPGTLFDRADIESIIRYAILENNGKLSTLVVQKYFKWGYGRALSFMDELEKFGFISRGSFGNSSDVLVRLDNLSESLDNYTNGVINIYNNLDSVADILNNNDNKSDDMIDSYSNVNKSDDMIDSYSNVNKSDGMTDLYSNDNHDTSINFDNYVNEMSEMLKQSPLYDKNNKIFVNKSDLDSVISKNADFSNVTSDSNADNVINFDNVSDAGFSNVSFDLNADNVINFDMMDDADFESIRNNISIDNEMSRKKIKSKKKKKVSNERKKSIIKKVLNKINDYFFGDEETLENIRLEEEERIRLMNDQMSKQTQHVTMEDLFFNGPDISKGKSR